MYTYLLLDILILAFPLALSFDKKVAFYKKWKYIWPGILVNLFVFLPWDMVFSSIGIWGFTPEYNLGLTLFYLPFEEYLFFLVVPYAAIFIYACAEVYITKDFLFRFRKLIAWLIILGALTLYGFHSEHLYTATASLFLSFGLLMILLSGRNLFLGRFFMTYLLILTPFLIFNGILTGLPVVWYNDVENMGIRLMHIPLEDLFYTMGMLLIPIGFYARLSRRGVSGSRLSAEAINEGE